MKKNRGFDVPKVAKTGNIGKKDYRLPSNSFVPLIQSLIQFFFFFFSFFFFVSK